MAKKALDFKFHNILKCKSICKRGVEGVVLADKSR